MAGRAMPGLAGLLRFATGPIAARSGTVSPWHAFGLEFDTVFDGTGAFGELRASYRIAAVKAAPGDRARDAGRTPRCLATLCRLLASTPGGRTARALHHMVVDPLSDQPACLVQ